LNSPERIFVKLLKDSNLSELNKFSALAATASNRQYYRLTLKNGSTLIAVYNDNVRENRAFFDYAVGLKKSSVAVPEVLAISEDEFWYLQTDLGDITLFHFLKQAKNQADFEPQREKKYQQIIDDLIQIQLKVPEHIRFESGFPRAAFDRQSIEWDLNYFKYYFLKLSGINFDEQMLQDEFNAFTQDLLNIPSGYFMYRDFQSRNIMCLDGKPYYIDFQGGRKGPLQYDLASLLFDAKAELPIDFRLKMLAYYKEQLKQFSHYSGLDFEIDFWKLALVRILQALGAYGFRGLIEHKQHFVQSIPLAFENLKWLLSNFSAASYYPYLTSLLEALPQSKEIKKVLPNQFENKLKLQLGSFSFKKGLPESKDEHGGGFIFDCRALHNPGRYTEYKTLTGKDKPVIDFFATMPEMEVFLSQVYQLVDFSVQTYLDRGFESLSVHFGCTGGQHRSVYCTEQLKAHLEQKFSIQIELKHRELEK